MLASEIFKRFGGSAGGGPGPGGIDLRARTIESDFNDPTWRIDADGFTYVFSGGSPIQDLSWISPQSGMSNYDVRATWLSGDVPSGSALSTWLNLSADRTWNWGGTVTSRINVEIRQSSTGSIIDSAIIKFHVPFSGGGGGGGGGINSSL